MSSASTTTTVALNGGPRHSYHNDRDTLIFRKRRGIEVLFDQDKGVLQVRKMVATGMDTHEQVRFICIPQEASRRYPHGRSTFSTKRLRRLLGRTGQRSQLALFSYALPIRISLRAVARPVASTEVSVVLSQRVLSFNGRDGMRLRNQKLWQAASCLLCVVVAQRNSLGLEGTEFSGGHVTGPLLDLLDIGSLLFVLALFLTFVYPRVAAAIAAVATLLCLPLYLYFTAPGPFRWVFKGEYSVPLQQANFVWDKWAILGMLTLAVATYICISNLSANKHVTPQTSE